MKKLFYSLICAVVILLIAISPKPLKSVDNTIAPTNNSQNLVSDTEIPILLLNKDYKPEKMSVQSAEDKVITKDNNKEFEALCKAEYLDLDKQEAFVKKYKGQTVEFDCIVLYLEQHPKYKTIYSYVIIPGEDKDNLGATLFYLDDMSMFDFKWDSKTRPEYLAPGSLIKLQAKIVTGEDPMYIYLDPIKSWGRK